MTSQIKGLIRFSMGLLVGLALMTSCGGDQAPDAEVGQLRLPLKTTSVEGVDFWLRGCFEIAGPDFPLVALLCTEDFAEDATTFNLSVSSGAYDVFLQDGWSLDYSAQGQPLLPVDPAKVQLTSANPQTVQVVTDQVTVAGIQFLVDQTAIDFGLGTLSIVPSVQVTGTLVVFITETLMDGYLGATPTAAIANADSICQGEADAANLLGTFRAWLSYVQPGIPPYNPASAWGPAMAGHRLVLPNGVSIAPTWESLLANGPTNNMCLGADGSGVLSPFVAWTGTRPDGYHQGDDCSEWTSDLAAARGTYGTCSFLGTDPGYWTLVTPDYPFYEPGTRSCENSYHLYCFQQPEPAP